MERYNCTCHCGGSMFYKHLHDPSCDLFMHGEEAPQSEEAQLQAALDAEREKVKRLSTCGTDHSTPWWQVKCEDLEAQLATLQAQLRKPILVCQRCGRVSQDGWVPSRYECDELNGSLQCPDCQCIDLEINTAKELAALCTRAQAQLADRDAMILQMGEQAAVLAKENMAVKAQLRQVEGELAAMKGATNASS